MLILNVTQLNPFLFKFPEVKYRYDELNDKNYDERILNELENENITPDEYRDDYQLDECIPQG